MSLESIVSMFTAFQRTAAVKAAIELDLFTAISRGADTAGTLAAKCQATERGIRILCDNAVVAYR